MINLMFNVHNEDRIEQLIKKQFRQHIHLWPRFNVPHGIL